MKTPQSGSRRKLSGFTLVELIVVITIITILGTIAFTQLGGYSSSARDGARISNLSNLHKGLTLFQIKSGTYPMPENPVNITASGTIIGYQGFAKDQVGSIAKLSPGAIKDPLDASMYTTYSVNANQTKMQLMSFLEDGGNVIAFVPNTYASIDSDYSKRSPVTKGDTLGILLGNSGSSLNQPVQELSSASFTGVDVVNTNTGHIAYLSNHIFITGTGSNLADLWDYDSIKAYLTLQDIGNISKNKKILVLYSWMNILENKYRNKGFNVIVDTGALSIDKVSAYNPDVILCDEHAWSCNFLFLNTLYNAGYKIASIWNDTYAGIPPILSSSSQIPLWQLAWTIKPDNISHFIARWWNTTTDSWGDTRRQILSIHLKAISIGKDTISNTTEIVYLEEPGKWKWMHYQSMFSPDDVLFDRANAYLLR